MRRLFSLLSLFALAACAHPAVDTSPKVDSDEARSAGAATVDDASQNAFGNQVDGLTSQQQTDFVVGNSFFKSAWVIAPSSTTGRDGLGPMLNATSCGACHPQDGRGLAQVPGQDALGVLLRIGGADGSPDPTYGNQLQSNAIPGARPEATVSLTYEAIPFTYPDGTGLTLRRPNYAATDWSLGDPMVGLKLSPRIGQQLPGLGLLEAVPDEAIVALADESDRDGDGVSGRPAWLVDAAGARHQGRFGWKAAQASLADQTASAFANDMGITSTLAPQDAMTATQQMHFGHLPNGGTPEISDDLFADVRFYLQTLAVPARRKASDKDVLAGKALFVQTGCAKCHTPVLQTGAHSIASIANQKIRPYTDLLLHDMGTELADNRAEGAATGMEWRTAPLWGLGLVTTVSGRADLLHDGRARNAEEAILWHGGEAEKSRSAFASLSAAERTQVLAFLKSL